ncbi:MAG: hypothetical protein QG608_3762 [Actinomycetota bacterium]|nr:hypothetical protein [Actinomycetota bacterium]
MSTPSYFRPEALKAARVRAGWTKRQLIHALRRAAHRQGIALVGDDSLTRAIASWENGHHFPTQYLDLLTEAYHSPAHELGLAPAQPEDAEPPASYPDTTSDAVTATASLWTADLRPGSDPDAFTVPGSLPREASLAWLVTPTGESLPIPGDGVHVGLADVQAIRTTVDMFVAMDNQFGGGHARRALIQYLADDVATLLAGTYTDIVGRDLFSAVAEANLLAAWMSYDSAHHALARRYFVLALRLAQAADDRRLAASILSAMSHQSTYLGHHREAADLARAAITGVHHHATPTMLAQFHAMEARALARAGDATGCSTALSKTTAEFERARPGDDTPDWMTYFNEAELSDELGHCFRDLGRPGEAVPYVKQPRTGPDVRSNFFGAIVLADTTFDAGEPEHACSVALTALHNSTHLKSARCAAYLTEFRARLDTVPTLPAVRDFIEQARHHRLWNHAARSTR